jgi:hypothetical protein
MFGPRRALIFRTRVVRGSLDENSEDKQESGESRRIRAAIRRQPQILAAKRWLVIFLSVGLTSLRIVAP